MRLSEKDRKDFLYAIKTYLNTLGVMEKELSQPDMVDAEWLKSELEYFQGDLDETIVDLDNRLFEYEEMEEEF